MIQQPKGLNELLVRAKCVRTNVVRALADVVATKLGIILLSFSFLPLTFLPEGICLRFLIFACLSK